MVDRLVVQTQDTIKSLAAESCDSNNDINHATGLVQDADNSKHLLLRLQDVVHRKDEMHPIEAKMQQAANDIHSTVVDYLKVIIIFIKQTKVVHIILFYWISQAEILMDKHQLGLPVFIYPLEVPNFIKMFLAVNVLK